MKQRVSDASDTFLDTGLPEIRYYPDPQVRIILPYATKKTHLTSEPHLTDLWDEDPTAYSTWKKETKTHNILEVLLKQMDLRLELFCWFCRTKGSPIKRSSKWISLKEPLGVIWSKIGFLRLHWMPGNQSTKCRSFLDLPFSVHFVRFDTKMQLYYIENA